MIVSSGYNVYPGQIENILDANEMVQMSCVIGIPDAYRMQKVKAFVKLAAGIPANDATRQALMSYCSKHIAKYAMPCDIEFRDELPKTLVGKVAYRVLEEEEQAQARRRGARRARRGGKEVRQKASRSQSGSPSARRKSPAGAGLFLIDMVEWARVMKRCWNAGKWIEIW